MPTRQQVLELLHDGYGYHEIGARLGIPAGQAYLIATGVPADGGDTLTAADRERPGYRIGSQTLVNPRQNDPSGDPGIRDWIRRRAHDDGPMQQARARRDAGSEA